MEVARSQALQYNMLAQNCYSSWFDIPVSFCLVVEGWMRLEGAALVDSLEALRVLDGHQELLSQVFK